MATFVNDLRLTELATGEGSGTWGTTTNTNLELIAESFSFGTEAITTNADTHTTTIADGSTDPGRSLFLKYTGTLDSACTITIGPNTVSKLWFIENATSGSQNIIISQGSGASITIANGQTKAIYSDGAGSGAAMVDAFQDLSIPDLFVDDDLTVGDDLILSSDSAIIKFGADADTTLTHTDGSGLTLNSTNKIMFNDASQFIQGSSATVLSLGATDEIDLTATAIDVNGTIDVSGNATLGGTLGVTGAVTANAGISIDNITIDGTEIDLSSGDLTIDVAGDIILDANGADVLLKDDGTTFGEFTNSSTDFVIKSSTSDKDMLFKGNDGGSEITALTLDMSAAGAATFNDKITAVGTSVFTNLDISGDVDIDGTTNLDVVDIDGAVDMASTLAVGGVLTANAGVVVDNITIDGTEIDLSSGDLTLDVAGDIKLDAGGSDIRLEVAGTQFGKFTRDGGDFVISSSENDKDMKFAGADGGADITALTLDMSAAGKAIFNAGIVVNESGGDNNTRFEGDSNTSLFEIDASADKIGVGTSAPSGLFHVYNGMLQVGSKTGDTSVQQNTNAIRIAAVPDSSTEWGGLQWYREFSDVIGCEIIAARASSAEADSDLIFKTSTASSNAVEAMRIDHSGNLQFAGVSSNTTVLSLNTSDGSDSKQLSLAGGGADSDGRGARIRLMGNEHASLGGDCDISTGNASGAQLDLRATGSTIFTTASVEHLKLDGSVVINEGSADLDLRVETDARSNGFVIDASTDNVGFMVTPVTDSLSSFNAVQFGQTGLIQSRQANPSISVNENVYRASSGSTGYKAIITQASSMITQAAGEIVFYANASASAGADVTLSQQAVIDTNGLSVGTTTTGNGSLSVAGVLALEPGGQVSIDASNSRPNLARNADGELRIAAGKDSNGFITFHVTPSGSTNVMERFKIAENITYTGRAGTSPIMSLVNSDTEDTATGRESTVRFSGFRSGGESCDNGQISGNHNGSSDDDDGMIMIWANRHADGLRERARFTDEDIVFNEGSDDVDFRFESDSNAHLIFADAGSSKVAIGTNSFTAVSSTCNVLHVAGGSSDAVTPVMMISDADGSVEGNSTILECLFSGDNSFSSAMYVKFTDAGGTQGSISGTGDGTVDFNTSSDERLKQNIKDTSSKWDLIKSLQVRDFEWKKSGKENTGFIAQELYEKWEQPVKVGGEDVEVDPWSVDYGKLTPILTKALQEAMEKIETLEAEVAKLKGE